MYKIELTRGSGWKPAVVATHSIAKAIHIADAQRLAEKLLEDNRRRPRGADGYRILDAAGRVSKIGP